MRCQRRHSESLQITALLCALLLAGVGCDPIRLVSVSERIPAPLDTSCMLDVLRSSEQVTATGVAERGVWAVLAVPTELKLPENRPAVTFEEIVGDDGNRRLELSMTWVGQSPTPEYRAHVERVMRELAQACTARCARAPR